jgi:hypothetical protein
MSSVPYETLLTSYEDARDAFETVSEIVKSKDETISKSLKAEYAATLSLLVCHERSIANRIAHAARSPDPADPAVCDCHFRPVDASQ